MGSTMLENLKKALIGTAAVIGTLIGIDLSFTLMNRPDDFLFYLGLFVLVTTVVISGSALVKFIKSFNQSNK